MPIFKRCSRCGKRILEGTKCTCKDKRYFEEDKYSANTKEKKFYKSTEWQKKRNYISTKFAGIDVYSYFAYNRIEPGEVVHHIVPIKDDWSLRLDSNNLIYLTEKNHQIIHAAMRSSKSEYEQVINRLSDMLIKANELFKEGGM